MKSTLNLMFDRLINILHVLVYSEWNFSTIVELVLQARSTYTCFFSKLFCLWTFLSLRKNLCHFFFLEEIWFEEMLYQSSGPIFHLDTSHLQDSTLYKKTYKTCFKNVIFSSQDPPFLIKKAWFLMINNSFIRSQRWLHLQMFRLFSIIFFLKPGTMQLRMSKTWITYVTDK